MLSRFKQRSYDLEHIDTGNYTADEYEGCIIELQRVKIATEHWHTEVSRLAFSRATRAGSEAVFAICVR